MEKPLTSRLPSSFIWAPQVTIWPEDRYACGSLKSPVRIRGVSGEAISISDPERTVVDVFRFRNRLGHDLAHTALRRYLRKPGADPSKIAALAKKLRVEGPLIRSLQILLA